MAHLLTATDDHFAWLLGQSTLPNGLREPAGGVDDADVLKMLRGATARLYTAGCQASWLIVDQDEVVGLCGFKRPPDANGVAEIGYGVSGSRRRRGYATAAVGLLIKDVAMTSVASRLLAQTAKSNLASQRVLERNGFTVDGSTHDPEEGALMIWTRALTQ
jgi:RimJ/RimL family protein N-acetyltransferase